MGRLWCLLLAGLFVAGMPNLRAGGEPDGGWLRKSHESGQSPFQQRAYGEIAKLKSCHLTNFMRPGGFEICEIATDDEKPAKVLYEMGLEVVPMLVEALGDTTPSSVVEPDRVPGGPDKTWTAGELAARLIWRITERNFSIGEFPAEKRLDRSIGMNPELVPEFQKIVMEWYEANHARTPEERKIADLEDKSTLNRLAAMGWLAKNRSERGRAGIIRNVGRLMEQKEKSSLLDAEMASAASTLAMIGGQEGLPSVRQICQKLADYPRRLPKPMKRPGIQTGVLFVCFEARAKLGEKQAALQELEEIYHWCEENMDQRERDDFQAHMKQAIGW